MTNKSILQINSSGRFEGSITRQLSQAVVSQIHKQQPKLSVVKRELATGLPFIDEQWIGANFTPADQRNARHREVLSFSDQLVEELQQADTIVIASPIYNFSIPAVLKAWIGLAWWLARNSRLSILNKGKRIIRRQESHRCCCIWRRSYR